MHVMQMILALDVVLMLADVLVLVVQFEEQGKEFQEFDNNFVTFLRDSGCSVPAI